MIGRLFLGLLVLLGVDGCSAQFSAEQMADYEALAVPANDVAQSRSAYSSMNTAPAAVNARTPGMGYDDSRAEPEPGIENLGAAETEKTRKLIRRADLRLQAPNPEAAEPLVLAAMEQYGAYSATTEIQENSRSYTIRVPERAFQPLLDALKGMGRMLYRSESAEDVTLKYYDLEGRLQTKQELRTTFQRYLGTAKTIEDIMAVETRIMELQNEIDWMGTELRSLANLVEYATISLEIRGPPSAAVYAKPTLGERFSALFGSFGDYASSALLILLGILVYGIPLLGILLLWYWLFFGKIGLMKKVWRIASGKGKGS
jgi:hypothetical protein